jgi:hypothetical protein
MYIWLNLISNDSHNGSRINLKFRIIVFPCEISCNAPIYLYIYILKIQPFAALCGRNIVIFMWEFKWIRESLKLWVAHLEGDKNGYRKFVQLFETESCRTEKKITHVNEVLFEFVAKKISSHMMKVKILYTILCFSFIYHLNLDVKKERHKKKNF